MRFAGPHLLWLLAAVLAVAVVAEAVPIAQRPPVAVATVPLGSAHAAAAGAEPVTDWVATVLSRPLFATDRRPVAPAASAPAATGAQALPRLAGIVVSPSGRSAIFAGNPDHSSEHSPEHSIVVAEGAAVGPWRVVAIRSDAVDVSGPQGERTVKPSYSNDPPQTASAAAPPVNATPGFAPFNPQNAALSNMRSPASLPLSFGGPAAMSLNRP